jgi:hypothetical protein
MPKATRKAPAQAELRPTWAGAFRVTKIVLVLVFSASFHLPPSKIDNENEHD